MATAQQQEQAGANGAGNESMAEAIAYEAQIATEAEEKRGEATKLTPELFLKLWPLLCRPIPEGFIQSIPPTKGKPYHSTGIRSVQVQVDRMNNVLTPMWWWDKVSYENDGRVAFVTVCVGSDYERALFSRKSAGGVEQGSTAGNIYKGSYTNAAKLAFARIGVGHEVYLGATDLDPDVSKELAEHAERGAPEPTGIGTQIAKKMVDRAWDLDLKDKLRLAASHVVGSDVGDIATKAKAQKVLAKFSFDEAEKLDVWLSRKADELATQQELGNG